MPNGVNLYHEYLFGHCDRSTLVRRRNNAPGLPGGGGVDLDTAERLGYRNIDSGDRVSGTNKGRMQGICCGITAAWMVALLGENSSAVEHQGFHSFFTGPLRFQGAYVKDFLPNATSLVTMLDRFGLRNSNPNTDSVNVSLNNIEQSIPAATQTWAGYISAYNHAVGIGYKANRWFILEPNGGLFEYQNRARFIEDLTDFLIARRNRKAPGVAASMSAYFYFRL